MATLNSAQMGPGGRPNVHRRIQSQQIPSSPIGMVGGSFGNFNIPGIGFNGGLGGGVGLGVSGEDQQGVPRGHGRRHSVNVLNKGAQNNLQPFNQFGQDGFDDGFVPPAAFGGHSRQASRADSTWRISGYFLLAQLLSILAVPFRWRCWCGWREQWYGGSCAGSGTAAKLAAISGGGRRTPPEDAFIQLS